MKKLARPVTELWRHLRNNLQPDLHWTTDYFAIQNCNAVLFRGVADVEGGVEGVRTSALLKTAEDDPLEIGIFQHLFPETCKKDALSDIFKNVAEIRGETNFFGVGGFWCLWIRPPPQLKLLSVALGPVRLFKVPIGWTDTDATSFDLFEVTLGQGQGQFTWPLLTSDYIMLLFVFFWGFLRPWIRFWTPPISISAPIGLREKRKKHSRSLEKWFGYESISVIFRPGSNRGPRVKK